VVTGIDPRMTCRDVQEEFRHVRKMDADIVPGQMQQIYEHLRLEMRGSKDIELEGAKKKQLRGPNIWARRLHGWMPDIYELRDYAESCIGNGWDPIWW